MRATLAAARVDSASPPEAESTLASVVAAPPIESPIALPAPVAAAAPPPAAAAREPSGGFGKPEVTWGLLQDRNRLGEFMTRQLTDFPVEVDRPARLDQDIVARYPSGAIAQGREESVAVWVVVDASGAADEIHVVDGAEDFAAEVVDAIRAARFIPAEDNLRPIRFPLALQFDFRLSGATARAR